MEGSWGANVDRLGRRGFGSSGCWAAIIAHILGFLTVGGGVGSFFVGRWGGLRLKSGDWSSPAFPGEGIVVVTTVGAVGAGGEASAGDSLGVTALGVCGVLAFVSRASMMKRTVGTGGMFLGASGRGVSKPIAVGALGVAVSLPCLLDLEPL